MQLIGHEHSPLIWDGRQFDRQTANVVIREIIRVIIANRREKYQPDGYEPRGQIDRWAYDAAGLIDRGFSDEEIKRYAWSAEDPALAVLVMQLVRGTLLSAGELEVKPENTDV